MQFFLHIPKYRRRFTKKESGTIKLTPHSPMQSEKEMKEGAIINFPRLIVYDNKKDLKCPVCGKTWNKEGRGYGFVKSGATTHVGFCFAQFLKSIGLQTKQPYNQKKLGWELELIPKQEEK